MSVSEFASTSADLATVGAALVLGAWSYSRYVANQIRRPAIEFTVTCMPVGLVAGRRLLAVTFLVRNAGSRECDVWLSWRLVDLPYDTTCIDWLPDPDQTGGKLEGQVKFKSIYSGALLRRKDLTEEQYQRFTDEEHERFHSSLGPDVPPDKYLKVLPYRTFVGADVTQRYSLVTDVAPDLAVIKVLGAIGYRQTRSKLASRLTPLIRWSSGLSEREVRAQTREHTVECVVALGHQSDH